MGFKLSKVFKDSGFFVLFIGFCQAMYTWGYMQSAVDYGVADFSAPPYTAIFSLTSWVVGAFIFFLISAILYKRGR